MKMRKFFLPLLGMALLQCSQAKSGNGLALLPLLMSGSESAPIAATVTPEASGNSFTVVSLDSSSSTATPSATSSSGESSSSTTTTPTITPSTESIITVVTATTTTTPVPPSSGTFNYESNITTNVNVVVVTPSGPVANAPVVITENTTSSEQNLIGTGQTNNQGTASIPVSVPPTVTNVNVNVIGQNPATGEGIVITGNAPIQAPSNTNSGSGGTSTVAVTPTVNLNTNNFQSPQGCLRDIDSDCDGVTNTLDEFPDDPNLVATSKSGTFTITFEDRFPNIGDGDLNDLVLVFATEMDRAPDNKVKTIRGLVTLIGRSTSGSQELRLSLKTRGNARLVQRYLEGGTISSPGWSTAIPWNGCATTAKLMSNRPDCLTNVALTKTEMETGLLMMPQSRATLYGVDHRAYRTVTQQTFTRGVTSEFEITFDSPEDLAGLGNIVNGHLNWFMVMGNRAIVRRAGYETETRACNGITAVRDRFVDCNGFPFSIIIPGVFDFQIDGSNITTANTTGYARFQSWATSGGTVDRDWYNFVTNRSRVVPIRSFYQRQGFTAYMVSSVKNHTELYALFLITIGAGLGFFFKRKYSK